MRNQRGLVVVGVLAWGCGGGGGGDDVEGDVLTIHASGSALVVGQDGDGAWQQLAVDTSGVAHLTVTSGFYGAIGFCTESDFPSTRAVARFAADFADIDLGCGASFDPVEIAGVTTPGTTVYAGQLFTAPADAAGMYRVNVPAGVHDVFAVLDGSPSRLLVRRGVDASSDVTLDLPIATEGVDMPTMTPVVTGPLSDETSVYADMNTANLADYAFFGSGPTSTPVPPPSVLVATDHAAIGVSTNTADTARTGCTRQVPLGAAAPALELPAPYTATFGPTQLAWDADDSIDWELAALSLRLAFQPGQTQSTTATFYASSGWLDAAGAGETLPVPDLATLPGWTAGLAAFGSGQEVDWNTWTNRGEPDADYVVCGTRGTVTLP